MTEITDSLKKHNDHLQRLYDGIIADLGKALSRIDQQEEQIKELKECLAMSHYGALEHELIDFGDRVKQALK